MSINPFQLWSRLTQSDESIALNLPPSRILVVDDVAENRDLLLRRLRRMNLTNAAEAENGLDALKQIREGTFDLVLLDVMMPELNGIETLRILRNEGRLEEMPVLMISAASEIEKVVECIELGAEDYLPKPFNPSLLTARVKAALERRHLRAENRRQLERLTREMGEARLQQLRMVPDEFDVDPARWDLSARMEPALEVGGDLYDVFEAAPGLLCVAVGDVAGKGVPAGLFMARTRSLLRGGTLQHLALAGAAPRPSEIAALLNTELCKNNPEAIFVTLFLAFVDLATGATIYCNAGHICPVIRQAGSGTLIEVRQPADPALGVIEDFDFTDRSLTLGPGELLLVSSDGLGDTHDANDALFGDARVREVLAATPDADTSATIDALVDAARDFAGATPQFDDITLLALRRLC